MEDIVIPDGGISVDIRTLQPEYLDGSNTWVEIIETFTFSFGQIQSLSYLDNLFSVKMIPKENGQEITYSWPMHNVQSIIHITNSDDVVEKLTIQHAQQHKEWEEKNAINRGIALLENFLETGNDIMARIKMQQDECHHHAMGLSVVTHILTCLDCGFQRMPTEEEEAEL